MADELCKSCGSCGFPMRSASDHAGGRLDADYCSTCGLDSGALKPFDEAVSANADYLVREQGLDPVAAHRMAAALLLTMPAWQGRQ
jgi:hypothetical protein